MNDPVIPKLILPGEAGLMDVDVIHDNPIANAAQYNIAMRRSMMDKMFFMDKIGNGPRTILDWGCADGSLIEYMHKMFPEHFYMGYDTDPKMIAQAQAMVDSIKLSQASKATMAMQGNVSPEQAFDLGQTAVGGLHFEISDDLSDFIAHRHGRKIDVVVLNSVIHEIYSYSLKEIETFWSTLFDRVRPGYIVVRDMCVERSTSRAADPISVARIKQLFDLDKIAQWESKWGSLHENWSLVNFLLTYRYADNWDREYRENYLPVSVESLLARFPREYTPTFVEHYTLPFLREQVMEDFGIQLQDRTHLKLILKLA